MRLAVLALAAPQARVLPQVNLAAATDVDRLGWNDDGGAAEAALWDEASSVWWELLP
jgi:hypothetical protein